MTERRETKSTLPDVSSNAESARSDQHLVSALVLTRNEERQLPGCLRSLSWCDDIHVYDSFSTDRTVAIARAAGARVTQRHFYNWAAHQNWAEPNIQCRTCRKAAGLPHLRRHSRTVGGLFRQGPLLKYCGTGVPPVNHAHDVLPRSNRIEKGYL